MSKISKKQQRLMKEELTRTQVLNLTDLEKVAKYEKSISKKPAITLAILGLFLLITGISYNGIINTLTTSTKNPAKIQNKEVKEEEINTTIKCNYMFFGNADGTDAVVDMTLNLVDNKLVSYNKVTTFVPTTGQEILGTASIQNLLPAYQALETFVIPGYTIKSVPKGNGFETTVNIDLQNINGDLLTNINIWNAATKVELALGDTPEIITTRAQDSGFTCE